MERMIKVTGKGNISVKPDMIRLTIDLEDMRKNYEETLEQSTMQVELLKDCFEKVGFDRRDLKTLRFNVDTEYESYQGKQKEWKRRFVGYKFTHTLKIEFDADNKKLGEVLYALAHAPIQPEFRIHYTVKDVEAAKNLLLGKAVEDSKEKASVLAEAAGVKLGKIVTIDYSWGEIAFLSEPMSRNMSIMTECCESPMGYDIDIEPDDIDVTDTVTIVWSIE